MKAQMLPTTDASLPAFDYTKLTAINVCPRWGLIRYDRHLRMPGTSRSTPLEMGSLAHHCFASVRIFELLEFGPRVYGEVYDPDAVHATGRRLFGVDRYAEVLRLQCSGDDTRRRVHAVAIHIANTSGYEDDPLDRRRTLSNLEASIAAYIDRGELGTRIPIIQPFVGVEVPFDATVTYQEASPGSDVSLRYVGKIDALVHPANDLDRIEIEENKTASRLDQSWQDSFLMSHQVTGYCLAAGVLTGKDVHDTMIRGMMVPLPRTYDMGGIVNMYVSRDRWRYIEWYKWVYDTYQVWLKWKDRPVEAPEYTHSCNRYFRSCSFIPLCAMADPDERALTMQQMVHDEWNPLMEAHAND